MHPSPRQAAKVRATDHDNGRATRRRPHGLRAGLAAALLVVLASCGGGGGSGSSGGGTTNGVQVTPSTGTAATAQACSPANPHRSEALAPTTLADMATEKAWIRQLFAQTYLWADEVPAVDARLAAYSDQSTAAAFDASIDRYFTDLLTPAITPSGARKDRFSFTFPTADFQQLLQGGSQLGYGIEWIFASPLPPRQIRVAFVHAGSPADRAGVQRGDFLLTVDNVSSDDGTAAGVAVLNAGTFPSTPSTHRLVFSRNGTAGSLPVDLTATTVALQPVAFRTIPTRVGTVGYLLFNDHIATAEANLIAAMQAFGQQGVSRLVIDLRYNGGGFLYIASELAYMVAGPVRTRDQVFARETFNAQRRREDAVTPFYGQACIAINDQCTSNAALPALGLSQVVVLTSGSTCSASEALVNGLRGVGVDVQLVGSTTCGKPYGFFGHDNCGISYFPIEFRTENALGFGDYADGLVPAGSGVGADQFPGCLASDDLDHALGDPAEGQLATALSLLTTGRCSAAQPAGAGRAQALQARRPTTTLLRPPLREAAFGHPAGRPAGR